jgi:hypothetical protein
MVGEEASHADVKKPKVRRDKDFHELAQLKLKAFESREEEGSFAEAVMRVVYAATKAAGQVDARGYVAARELWAKHPRLASLPRAKFLAEAKEAALMVAFDEERALATLPQLLPTPEERREAYEFLRRLTGWRPKMLPEVEALMARVARILEISPEIAAADEAAAEAPKPPAKPRSAAAEKAPAAITSASSAARRTPTPRRRPSSPRRTAKTSQ